jgi:hypothetical protein
MFRDLAEAAEACATLPTLRDPAHIVEGAAAPVQRRTARHVKL